MDEHPEARLLREIAGQVTKLADECEDAFEKYWGWVPVDEAMRDPIWNFAARLNERADAYPPLVSEGKTMQTNDESREHKRAVTLKALTLHIGRKAYEQILEEDSQLAVLLGAAVANGASRADIRHTLVEVGMYGNQLAACLAAAVYLADWQRTQREEAERITAGQCACSGQTNSLQYEAVGA